MTVPAPPLAIAPVEDADLAEMVALWRRGLTRPWNDPAADIALAPNGSMAASRHRKPNSTDMT